MRYIFSVIVTLDRSCREQKADGGRCGSLRCHKRKLHRERSCNLSGWFFCTPSEEYLGVDSVPRWQNSQEASDAYAVTSSKQDDGDRGSDEDVHVAGTTGLHPCLSAEWLSKHDLKGSGGFWEQAVTGVLTEVKESERVIFISASGHVNVRGNERADRLADRWWSKLID